MCHRTAHAATDKSDRIDCRLLPLSALCRKPGSCVPVSLFHWSLITGHCFSGLHQRLSDGTLRQCLPVPGLSVLDYIQTGADFFSAKNIDNKVNEREQSRKGRKT